MSSTRDTTFTTTNVNHLASIFFHMNALDTHMSHIAIFGARHISSSRAFSTRFARLQIDNINTFFSCRTIYIQIKMATHAERYRTLRGLEVLCHIGIHIVLAIEHGTLFDIAVSCKACKHNRLNSSLVRYGQSPR